MGDRRSWGMSFLGYVTKAAVSAILIKGTRRSAITQARASDAASNLSSCFDSWFRPAPLLALTRHDASH